MKNSSRRKQTTRQLAYQNLEPRQLLAGLPIITEFLASNSEGIPDDNGNTSDWIEIYNAGDAAINLAGYTLTDDAGNPDRWTFPSIVLADGAFLVVRATTDADPTGGSPLYTGFGLSADGEYLGLYDSAGNVVSEFGAGGADYPAQLTDISYGVQFGGNFDQVSYFATPTPGTANTNPVAGVVERVSATLPAGFYDTNQSVSLSTPTVGATIYYTTDGSTPSASNGTQYDNNNPILITQTTNLRAVATRPGYLSVADRTWSYLYIDEILTSQANSNPLAIPTDGGDWTSNWGSHVVDYNLDPTVIAREGVAAVKEALLSIPSWSITTDYDNLFDPNTGIYANPLDTTEVPASVELLNPDGSEGFQVNAGLRIRGGFSRSDSNPKHSFRLFFGSEYGDSELNYPVHGDTGTDTFENLDLRTSQNYSWNKTGDNPALNNFIVDRFSRLNQGITGQPYTRSTFLHLYINGQYWGLYETQERAEANFAASYFGGDSDDYDVIKTDAGRIGTRNNIATDGNLDAYDDFRQLTFASDLANDADYLRLQGLNADGTRNTDFPVYLDVDNLISYATEILYSGNPDAPISAFFGNDELNNYFAIRDRTDSSTGFKFFVHDAEHAYGLRDGVNSDRTGPFTDPDLEELDGFNPQTLHQELMANDEYRTRFADFIQENFFNDGPFTVENLQARWDVEVDKISSAIIAESARWGDARSERANDPYDKSDWEIAVDGIRNGFIGQRQEIFLDQLRDTSPALFPDVDAPSFQIDGTNQSGGEISAGDLLTLTADDTIYFTTDGSDPRATGGGVSSSAILYNPEVVNTTLVNFGDNWNFLDDGSNQGTAWRSVAFNDSGWANGPSEFGYGDNSQATETADDAEDGDQVITTYFRTTFDVAAGVYSGATLDLIRDDAAVVYLNGVELFRSNFDADTQVLFNTFADDTATNNNENDPDIFDFDPALLLIGSNTLAVEIHQVSATSSDVAFNARLTVSTQNNAAAIPLDISTNVKARTFSNGEWSAVHDATFAIPVSQSDLRISEIHFNPADATAAEIAAGFGDNDDFEFIEIYNPSTTGTINLDGLTLADGVTFSFGNENLAPGERAVVVEDFDAFRERYGDDIRVLGEWSGGLSGSGETIELLDSDFNEIMSVDYQDNDPWYVAADGFGFSLVLDDPAGTPDAELGKYYSWRASTELGGTPGAGSTAPLGVVVNEVLAHTDFQSDSIELFNPTTSDINVGGWFLSDSGSDLLKYQIPAGTVLSANGYLVFDESDFNPTPSAPAANHFALGSTGDQVYLSQASDGNFLSLQDSVEFDATFNGDSLGRLPNGTGRLTRLAESSFGSANGVAAVSPLVISEINYHPEDPSSSALAIDPLLTDNDLEFIEIANPTGAAIDLTNWRLRGEVDYDFAAGTLIAAGGSITVLSFDPDDSLNDDKASAFEAHYGISLTANFVGGFDGSLSNSTGRVSLQQPDTPDALGLIPHVVVDEVVYDDLSPWADADGSSDSLNRVSAVVNGNFASSWSADAPTPGVSNLVASAPQVVSTIRDGGSISRPDLWTTFAVQFSADVDVNVAALSLVNDSTGGALVDLSGITMNYVSSTSTATWDLSGLNTALPAAFYTVILNDNLVTGNGGGLLDGDGNGSSGGTYTTEIYQAIPGDANLDGKVDVLGDGFVLVGNLGANGGSVWTDGDFSADGNVDVLADAFLLVGNLGRNVIPPASATSQLFSQSVSQSVLSVDASQGPVLFEASSLENASEEEDHVSQAMPVDSSQPVLAGSQSLDEAFASDDWLI